MNKLKNIVEKYLLPHDGNDFKPHFLRDECMTLLFALIVIVELGFLVHVFVIFDKTKFLASVLPGVLTTLTNEERAANDAPPLVENELLRRAAEMKAADMANNGYFAHVSPDGKTPWYWFDMVGYKYVYAGENLAVNFFESEDVAEAWMNSPSHRANVIKKDFTEIGIGVASGMYEGKNTVFVAELFGKPLVIPTIDPVVIPPVAEAPATSPAPSTPTPAPELIEPEGSSEPERPTPTPVTPAEVPTEAPVIPIEEVAPPPIDTQVLGEEVVGLETAKNSSNIRLFIQRILSSPRESVNYLYVGIGLFLALILALAIIIGTHVKHPVVVVRGVAMIAFIVLLSFINFELLTNKTVVPKVDWSASSINSIEFAQE